MIERDAAIETLDDLRAFVHAELCKSENLLAEQFHTQSQPLFIKGQLCGMEFSLQGLRAIRLGAIWAADQNVIFFYNAKGERNLKIKLARRINMDSIAAAG